MGRRILNDALRTIVNAEKRGFASAELKPISNVVASFLQIMKYRGMKSPVLTAGSLSLAIVFYFFLIFK